MMRMKMPSGRSLCYIKPRLAKNAKGRLGIKYWGIHQKTKQWCELDLYGGRGVENLVQAFARDCLAVTMVKLYRTGYQMIMLVHDEIVFDLPLGFGSLAGVLGVMREEIPFAKGLPLKGAGYDDAPFYYKD
jgi:DNA polymerase